MTGSMRHDSSRVVRFRIYFQKVLLPVLWPGHILVLDKLSSHRSKAGGQLIRSVDA